MFINNSLYRSDIDSIIEDYFSYFRGKSFFITGASGLIGSCIIDVIMYLNEVFNYGITVYALFSNKQSFEQRFPSYKTNQYFNVVIKNLMYPCNFDFMSDFIIHTASNTHPQLYLKKPIETIMLNVTGTSNVLEYADRNPNSRTLFLSSFEVYGKGNESDGFLEDNVGFVDFITPRSCYPESKRVCETLCQSYIYEKNIDAVIARLGYIYGPTVKTDSSKADVQFLNNALRGEPIVMRSLGMQLRSYLYVFDTVSAILYLLINGGSGEIYNIAASYGNVMLKDFALKLSEIARVPIKLDLFSEQGMVGRSGKENLTLNMNKILNLGWLPKFSLEDSILHTYKIKKEIYKM